MSFLRRFSLLAATITAFALISAAAEQPPKPSPEQIAKWVRQLGDDDFNVRETASKKLYEAGQPAEAALQEATASSDAEVARRAGEIMDRFKWGLYPDAPKEVVDLVTRYRSANPQNKQEVIRELLKAGPGAFGPLTKIVRAEEDENVRAGLFDLIQKELSLKAPALIAAENYDSLEPLIELLVAADVERGAGYYAAYWQLRGKIDERIAHLKKTTGKGPDAKRNEEIIAYLCRAKGDLTGARAAAEQADKPALIEALLVEAGDWKELAKRATDREGRSPTESLGFHAAYCRLAGDAKGFEAAVADLRKLAGAGPIVDYENLYLSKVLFLNDRPTEAADLLVRSPNAEDMAFEILIAQTKYQAALELADGAIKAGSTQKDELEILKARTLYLLGEKDKAKAIFARFGDQIKTGAVMPWPDNLIDAEVRVGLQDLAFETAANILNFSRDQDAAKRLLPKLFPKNGETAEVLWVILRGNYAARAPDTARMEPAAALKKVRELIDGKTTSTELAALVGKAEDDIERIPGVEKQKWRAALAEAALIVKDEALARSLFTKAGSQAALMRLGDLDAERQEWAKASEHYRQAWEKAPGDPLPYYLSGWALAQSGKDNEGKKCMAQAHLMPLGDGLVRFNFLKGLLERGRNEDAAREGELMLGLDAPGSQIASEGMRQVALAAMRRKDYLAAAQGQERSMLVCLKAGVGYARPAAYLWVPALVHRLRAEGYVAAGQFDEGRRETDLCWAALPGDAFVPTEVVPMYDKAGREKEATELFEKYLKVQEKLCETYPTYSSGHNAAAWLSACCHRNLESAEDHARKAVELSPDNAGVLDTLAEVQFQLGKKDEAIATQKKAVALEPKRVYFRKQLTRIEAGDPAAERPPENDDDD